MTRNENAVITSITVTSSNDDVIALLKAQYSHLEGGEARALLEHMHNSVWTNDQLMETFEVSHFEPPYVHVIRKEDKARGTIMFVDSPRFYFSFSAESEDDERNQTRV
jgi:hypothetical protein